MKIAVLSDAHGNVESLAMALDIAEKEEVSECFFLGDALGYIPAIETLDILAAARIKTTCIMGNHEANLLSLEKDLVSDDVTKHNIIAKLLNPHHWSQIASWPKSSESYFDGIRVLFVHGSPNNPTLGYVYPDSTLNFGNVYKEFDYIFMGNTHRAFVKKICKTTYVNVGSVGIPRDNGELASFAILDSRTREVEMVRFNISGSISNLHRTFGNQIHPLVYQNFQRREEL